MICPECKQPRCGVEYTFDSPQHYDGVSEWVCLTEDCSMENVRVGRRTGNWLEDGQVEPRFGGE